MEDRVKKTMKPSLNKKGQAFGQLIGLATGLATLVIVFAVLFLVLANVRTNIASTEGLELTNLTQADDSIALNATATLTTAASTVPTFVPLIVITVIGAVLIGLVSMFGRR